MGYWQNIAQIGLRFPIALIERKLMMIGYSFLSHYISCIYMLRYKCQNLPYFDSLFYQSR